MTRTVTGRGLQIRQLHASFNSAEGCVELLRSGFQELVQRIDEKFASLRAQTALRGQQGT